ncbi:MAG: universal stress protein [Thermoleophilia bacterium]
MRIVLGFDGSPVARLALERAASLAGPGGHVAVVSALPTESPFLRPGIPFDEEDVAEQRRELDGAGALLRERGVEHSLLDPVGDPAETLCEVARERVADLIVVGSHGRGAAARALLGSVSSSVVHHAPCDVLVVRLPG